MPKAAGRACLMPVVRTIIWLVDESILVQRG